MPRLKLTARTVARLMAPDPSGRQQLHWDTELRGFGVLCSGTTGAKTYVVQREVNGRTRRVTVAAVNVLDLDKARERAQIVLADFFRGIDPKAARRSAMTLRDALGYYLQGRKALREKTRRDYQGVEKYLGSWLDRRLQDITSEEVEKRHREIAKAISAEGRYSGEAAANATMRTFRAIYNFAAEHTTLPPNPVRHLKRQWFKVEARDRYVTAGQLPKFYAAILELQSPIARDYLLLLLFTGLRRNEAASLTWQDVDLHEKVIRIPAFRTKPGRKLDLPMTDLVFDLFTERCRLGRDQYVFPSNSKSGYIAEPKFPLQQVALVCGVQVSAHDLRRTYITVAESADISPLALKALVNHALGGSVTEGYVQMTAERLREPAQKVADKMKRLCGIVAEHRP